MGHFARFPDELLMELLGYIEDPQDLLALSHTSRVFYAYVYDEDLWKRMYVQRVPQDGLKNPTWRGSWRQTVLGIDPENLANLQIPDNLVCLDVLYRPFQCAQVDYEKIFKRVIAEETAAHQMAIDGDVSSKEPLPGRVDRISETAMSETDFSSRSEAPFILTNSEQSRWPQWTMGELLLRFPAVTFRQEAVKWPLSLYAQYLAQNWDESLLYLFDCGSQAMKELQKEYQPPQIFAPDIFSVFESCRPDHAWLIVGARRLGSTFHKDPNSTCAWNAAIQGRKLWVMLPPEVIPPGVTVDATESEVTAPVGLAEWVLLGFYNDAVKMPESKIAITFPGECMYVPAGWWHAVINLDDTIALTQNFVPPHAAGKVLHFFDRKREQVLGFRPRDVREAMEEILSLDAPLSDPDMSDLLSTTEMSFYSSQYDRLNLQGLDTEDCGEIAARQLPPMPIFELFKHLLVKNGKAETLRVGLQEMERLKKADRAGEKSDRWQELAQGDAFSFGFGEIE